MIFSGTLVLSFLLLPHAFLLVPIRAASGLQSEGALATDVLGPAL